MGDFLAHWNDIAKKTKYSPLKKDEKLNEKIARIFKDNSIGVLSVVKEYKGDYYEDCKQAFLQAYEFLFVGKFHEIYVLNNYLKHNMITMRYAPKAKFNDRQISIPFVYIDRPNDRLLNPSIYKYLFEHELDSDGKVTSAPNDYFVDIINATARPVCTVGGLKIYNINGIEYLKGREIVGLSMESIVDMTQELTQNIVKVFLGSSKGNETREQKLSSLISKITERTPQTLTKLINS